MDYLQLKDISERYMELINPSSPEKVLKVGRIAGMKAGSRVIDFGCGFGEALALWIEQFGVEGVGIELREYAANRAQQKMAHRGFADRIKIVQGDAAAYKFEPHTFDVAVSMGTSFIWGGYAPTIRAMNEAIRPGGKLIVGEPYWLTSLAPPLYAQRERLHTERELLGLARAEGFDVETIVRSNHDDWDRYESDNWYGLLRWIEENPDHPERQQVIDHLHESQDEYFQFAREYCGWAMVVLHPRQ